MKTQFGLSGLFLTLIFVSLIFYFLTFSTTIKEERLHDIPVYTPAFDRTLIQKVTQFIDKKEFGWPAKISTKTKFEKVEFVNPYYGNEVLLKLEERIVCEPIAWFAVFADTLLALVITLLCSISISFLNRRSRVGKRCHLLTDDDQSMIADGIIKKVAVLTGLNRIEHEADGSLFVFSIPKTVDGRKFHFHCMFSVVPKCSFNDALSLHDVFENRKLTQFYSWQIDVATGEQRDLEIRQKKNKR